MQTRKRRGRRVVTTDIEVALEAIREANEGILRAGDVVQTASAQTHPLHDRFEWDNTKAARAHRLWQAQHLIASVTVERGGVRVQKYISLSVDRLQEGGGYRPTDAVMAAEVLREIALKDALRDLTIFRQKYGSLQRLAGVVAAIDAVTSPEAVAA